jgi:hypothetical protein
MIPVLFSFPLDALQIRATVPEEARPAIQAGAVIVEVKHLFGLAILALLGVGGWKTSGTAQWEPSSGRMAPRNVDLVVKAGLSGGSEGKN